MKSEIIILNYIKYVKDQKKKSSIEFALTDIQDTEKCKGISTIKCFYDGHDVFDKLNKDLILKRCIGEFEIKQDLYDPLSCRKILKKVNNIELY